MNGKIGIAMAAIWLAGLGLATGTLADEQGDADASPQQETREQAESAHREAVDLALTRMRTATRLDLEVELPSTAPTPVSGD